MAASFAAMLACEWRILPYGKSALRAEFNQNAYYRDSATARRYS
jgi:hypothetical protein